MPRRPHPLAPRAMIALACAGLLAACAVIPPVAPGGGSGENKVNKATDAKKPASSEPSAAASVPAPTASQGAAATPEPLPSLGLLLAGQVKIDASALLKLGIAERTPVGAKLISNNGPGLISDKGVGLISNNSGALISNNSGGIVSKTKYVLTQAEGGRVPVPVQGLVVVAVSLRTNEILAGPVATDAEGRYRLGFIAKPDTNMRIVAYVNNKQADGAFTYGAFIPPAEAEVVTTDTTDLVCEYMVRVLAGRVQGGIDARKRGELVDISTKQFDSEAEKKQAEDVNEVLAKITPEMAATLDQEGQTARKFAERTVSFADLSKPVFKELHDIFDRLRAFDAGLAAPPTPSVPDEVVALFYDVNTIDDVPAALMKHGMPEAEAKALFDRMQATAADLNAELARVGNENTAEVLSPLLEVPGITDYLPLFEKSPAPSAQP